MNNKILLAIVGILSLIIIFFIFNNYIYNEKQDSNVDKPVFTWKYEKADSMNPDGNPETKIILEVKNSRGIENKLIDTVSGSCNDLPDKDADSVINSKNIQCYYAGLGYVYKITKNERNYLQNYSIERKTFEEGSDEYNPPIQEFQIIYGFSI